MSTETAKARPGQPGVAELLMSMAKPEKGEDPLAPLFPYVSVMNNVVYGQRANTAPGPVTVPPPIILLTQRTAANPLIGHLLW